MRYFAGGFDSCAGLVVVPVFDVDFAGAFFFGGAFFLGAGSVSSTTTFFGGSA